MPFVQSSGTTTNVVQIYSPDNYFWDQYHCYMTSTTTTNNIWDYWNSPFDQTGSSLTNIWATWNSMPTRTWSGYAGEIAREELRALREMPSRSEVEWAEIRAEQEREREQRDRLNAAARAEAHKLLAMILTPDQIASYEARRYFEVIGSAGGRYRIHHGTSGNIRQVVDGQEVNRLCVHPRLYADPRGFLPTEDCLAAQALALMHDEMGTVATANVHSGPRHLAAVA